jgi:hypothetical protein
MRRQPLISPLPPRVAGVLLGVVAEIPDERNRSRLPIKFGNVFISQSELDGDLLHTPKLLKKAATKFYPENRKR